MSSALFYLDTGYQPSMEANHDDIINPSTRLPFQSEAYIQFIGK